MDRRGLLVAHMAVEKAAERPLVTELLPMVAATEAADMAAVVGGMVSPRRNTGAQLGHYRNAIVSPCYDTALRFCLRMYLLLPKAV